jgi:hypothetical protein
MESIIETKASTHLPVIHGVHPDLDVTSVVRRVG